jgi:hypothetical protein
MDSKLSQLHQQYDDYAVVFIDINRPGFQGIDWNSPVAREFSIRSTPFVAIVDERGNVLALGKKAIDQIVQLIGT